MAATVNGPDAGLDSAAIEDTAWTREVVLANRRWLWRRKPFPHVTARQVFLPAFYGEGESITYNSEYDFVGGPLTDAAPTPLQFFLSPEWHDPFVSMFGFEPVPYVSAGIHRHRPGSRSGFPHNDIKVEPLPQEASTTVGAGSPGQQMDIKGVGGQCVRGAAILFYLNGNGWQAGDGGGTGLYRHWSDAVTSPYSIIPPFDNSFLAFECSPYSYHSFLTNRRQRDSIVVFLYRSLESYLELWGQEGVSQYADG